MKTIELKNGMYYLPIIKNKPFTFWKYIFQEWCHINNIQVISYKLQYRIYEKLESNSLNKLPYFPFNVSSNNSFVY